jgi:hypothetical protein
VGECTGYACLCPLSMFHVQYMKKELGMKWLQYDMMRKIDGVE